MLCGEPIYKFCYPTEWSFDYFVRKGTRTLHLDGLNAMNQIVGTCYLQVVLESGRQMKILRGKRAVFEGLHYLKFCWIRNILKGYFLKWRKDSRTQSRSELTFPIDASDWTFFSLLSPQASHLRLFFLSDSNDTKKLKKTWNQTQVLFLCKRLFLPLAHGSSGTKLETNWFSTLFFRSFFCATPTGNATGEPFSTGPPRTSDSWGRKNLSEKVRRKTSKRIKTNRQRWPSVKKMEFCPNHF